MFADGLGGYRTNITEEQLKGAPKFSGTSRSLAGRLPTGPRPCLFSEGLPAGSARCDGRHSACPSGRCHRDVRAQSGDAYIALQEVIPSFVIHSTFAPTFQPSPLTMCSLPSSVFTVAMPLSSILVTVPVIVCAIARGV